MEVIRDRELHEECGVFGIYGVPDAASLTYYGLHALQHRGQEGAGIVSVDENGAFRRIKGEGLVTEVFNEEKLATLKGSMAIGHVRYTTAGGGGVENVQPFLFRPLCRLARPPFLQDAGSLPLCWALCRQPKSKIRRDPYDCLLERDIE